MGEQRNKWAPSTHKRVLLAGAIIVGSSLCGPMMPVTARASDDGAPTGGPYVLDGPVVEVLVRVREVASLFGHADRGHPVRRHGGALRAEPQRRGRPPHGRSQRRRVHSGGSAGRHPVPRRCGKAEFDAAVLVMDRVVAGPSATIGRALPTRGSLTLAGYQAIDSDGTLLRGSTPHDRPLPKGATGPVIRLRARVPAGCTEAVASLEISTNVVEVHCGLIPGASGGGLFADNGSEPMLVGIVSTVSADVSANGVVPISALHELLEHPERYYHGLSELSAHARTTHTRTVLS